MNHNHSQNTMTPDNEMTPDHPFPFKGREIEFQDECKGTIADETEDALYEAVTLADTKAAAEKYLKQDALVIAIVRPGNPAAS